MLKYWCKKCVKEISAKEIDPSFRFCPTCGNRVDPITRQDGSLLSPGSKRPKIHWIEQSEVNIETLYHEFDHEENFEAGEGRVWKTAFDWIFSRKAAYAEYQGKFNVNNLANEKALAENFHSWLLFKNNKSWTTCQRTATAALNDLKSLAKLLTLLQDESLPIAERVSRGLEGEEKIPGISNAILTSLLHTLYPDKYGVWNGRTEKTLTRFHAMPQLKNNIGLFYEEMNTELLKLADYLHTDLTTIDGFVLYVDEYIKIRGID